MKLNKKLLLTINYLFDLCVFFFYAFLEIINPFRKIFQIGYCDERKNLHGKTVIITGANCGIGFEVAKALAKQGAKVVMACRDLNKAEEARQTIIEKSSNQKTDVIIKKVDLSSLSSVRKLADEMNKEFPSIDILINNGGIVSNDDRLTEDGYECHFGVNYLSHFLLTRLLLEKIQSSKGKVINISSDAHFFSKLNMRNIEQKATSKHSYSGYADSKFAQVLFTRELAKRCPDLNLYAVHPGFVRTKVFRNYYIFVKLVSRLFGRSAWQGAQPILHCVFNDQASIETGFYYRSKSPSRCSSLVHNRRLAIRLWDYSCDVLDLKKEI